MSLKLLSESVIEDRVILVWQSAGEGQGQNSNCTFCQRDSSESGSPLCGGTSLLLSILAFSTMETNKLQTSFERWRMNFPSESILWDKRHIWATNQSRSRSFCIQGLLELLETTRWSDKATDAVPEGITQTTSAFFQVSICLYCHWSCLVHNW